MHKISDISELEAIYGLASGPPVDKVTDHLTPSYAAWIAQSRFCVLSTVGPEGTDGSPRGDTDPVVHVQDSQTLLLPDWRGNKRVDTLRNIVRDGRISLMFLIPGSGNAMRVNGSAFVTADPEITGQFVRDGQHPATVIVIKIAEVYSQCARAIKRSGLWTSGDESSGLPTTGQMLADAKAGFDGAAYDAGWAERAKGSMW